MSVRECNRCNARTTNGRQCTRNTCMYPRKCWQHFQKATGLELRNSRIPGAGKGLFVKRLSVKDIRDGKTGIIKKGSHFTSYLGVVKSLAQYTRERGSYGVNITKNPQTGAKEVVDAKSTQSCIARYANDCRPRNRTAGHCVGNNVGFGIMPGKRRGENNTLVATKDIHPGEEIYASYGAPYWRAAASDAAAAKKARS